MQEALAVALLAAVLVVAVVRPRALPEAAVTVPAALLLVVLQVVSWSHARDELSRLAPVVGFLAAILVLADGCAAEGLFAAVGGLLARRSQGRALRLLTGTFVTAALTTAVLSLDTTVVLLTPVVLVTATRAGVSPRPALYACAHLSNSASLLLPVSNLTNLLAIAVVPISFTRFAALMALPWVVVVAVELVVFRWFFRRDLVAGAVTDEPVDEPVDVAVPWFALAVVVATLLGFVVTSLVGVAPAWAAAGGASLLAVKRLVQRRTGLARVIGSGAPAFCLFVLALGVVVRAVSDHGLGRLLSDVLPHGSSLPALLGVAAIAAVAANLLNNLPATLLLLPAAAGGGVGPVLAVLVGVDVGPNLTYVGSLATLLWRRVLHTDARVPSIGEFSRLAVATVPATVVAGTVALWLSLRWIGG